MSAKPMTCERKIGPYQCCSVVQGDCLELMKQLPDGCVDAVITDPPYGLGFKGKSWDSHIPEWFPHAERIVSGCILFTTAPTTMWDYPRPDWVMNWYRPASSARMASGGFNHWSPVLAYGRVCAEVDSINLHAIANAYPSDFPHPSPKPEALMDWLVEMTNGLVVDPFTGSGTTLVAAKKLGRHFLGFEISEAYCQIARERLARIDAQPNLFAPKAEQLALA